MMAKMLLDGYITWSYPALEVKAYLRVLLSSVDLVKYDLPHVGFAALC